MWSVIDYYLSFTSRSTPNPLADSGGPHKPSRTHSNAFLKSKRTEGTPIVSIRFATFVERSGDDHDAWPVGHGQSAVAACDRWLFSTRLPVLFGDVAEDQWVVIGANGHYRGSEAIDSHLVYTVLLEDGSNRIFTPSDFQDRFHWKNESDKAFLVGPAVD